MSDAPDDPAVGTSIDVLDGRTPVVVLRSFVAGLLFVVVVFTVVASDRHEPHIELAPPSVSAAIAAVPVASGAVAPEGWWP
jgi:hypothetical protein